MQSNSLSLLLICSQLGLEDESIKPLTLREWNPIVRKMQVIGIRPSDLVSLSDPDLSQKLDIDTGLASRVSRLLSREIQTELDRLASIGIQPLTRADPDYPEKYRQRLKDSAPPSCFTQEKRLSLGSLASRWSDRVTWMRRGRNAQNLWGTPAGCQVRSCIRVVQKGWTHSAWTAPSMHVELLWAYWRLTWNEQYGVGRMH